MAAPHAGGEAGWIGACFVGREAVAHGPDADVVRGFGIQQSQEGASGGCELKLQLGEVVLPVQDGTACSCNCEAGQSPLWMNPLAAALAACRAYQ